MPTKRKIKELLSDAWSKRRSRNYDSARDLVKQAEALCAEDDYNSLGRIHHIHMQFNWDHDQLEQALAHCQQSLNYYHKEDDRDRIAHSTRHMADLLRQLKQYNKSEFNYRQAIDIYKSAFTVNPGNLANALRGFAILLEAQEKFEEASIAWKETKDLYTVCNIQEGVVEANQRLEALR